MPWNEEDYATVPAKYRAKLASAARGVIADVEMNNILMLSVAFTQVVQSVIAPIATALEKGPEWINQHPIATIYLAKMIELNYPFDEPLSSKEVGKDISRLVHEWAKQ